MMKTCTKCKNSKPRLEFHKDSSSADGLFRWCKQCCKKRRSEYYESNKDVELASNRSWSANNARRVSASNKAWREKNASRKQESNKQWRQNNAERVSFRQRQWAEENKSKVLVYKANRRAAQMNATPCWLTAIQKAQIQEMYDIAVARSVQTGVAHQVDHIHPLQGKTAKGLHVPWNLQVITASENARKHNKVLP